MKNKLTLDEVNSLIENLLKKEANELKIYNILLQAKIIGYYNKIDNKKNKEDYKEYFDIDDDNGEK